MHEMKFKIALRHLAFEGGPTQIQDRFVIYTAIFIVIRLRDLRTELYKITQTIA